MTKKVKTTNTRQFKRLNVFYLVKYRVSGSKEEPQMANVKNVSAGGLKILTKEILPEKETLELTILIPHLKHTIEAKGVALRVRKADDSGTFAVAVQFTDISANDQNALNHFIENLAHDKEGHKLIDQQEKVERKLPPSEPKKP